MVFFTTPELLEIGDVPFTTALGEAYAARRRSNITAVFAEHYHFADPPSTNG